MDCIAKVTEMYFSGPERSAPCHGPVLELGEFWAWHVSGNLNACICERHADFVAPRWTISKRKLKGYLVDKIRQARIHCARKLDAAAER